jgi:tetratricopeptide (TPR) repeat protein
LSADHPVRAAAAAGKFSGIDTRIRAHAPLDDGGLSPRATDVRTAEDLAALLRDLRRRHARRDGAAELTYRELAAATGWSHGIIGGYLTGRVLPPTDRLDALVRLLGATPAEQGALATARDRVEEARRGSGAAEPGRSVPRQLPLDVPGFIGRERELTELDVVLAQGGPDGPVLCAVAGTAGVGKTALAIRWAHRVADRFPDGQLYLDLRGYDPGPPVPPADALAGFLRALGVEAAAVPADLAERAARYRTMLAGRRVLVVLDNAAGADQVRPLLPGTGPAAVLVTSRADLAGLVARDGARRIELDVLGPAEARRLLGTLIGGRTADEPDAAGTLADECARLPLALRIAAEFATAHPELPLSELATELRDEAHRLDLLDAAGDPRTAVRSVFSWSYRHLTPAGADLFGLLGLHPGRHITAYPAAALAGADLSTARNLLRELSRAHLVEPDGTGGYGMHDLLRAYAVERVHADLRGDARCAALTRLFDHYLDTATAASDTLYPHDRANPDPASAPDPPPNPVPAPPVDTPERALAWLDEHRADLVAVAVHAAGHGWPRHAAGLSCALWRYLEVGGHYQEALALHTAAAGTDTGTYQHAAVLANLGGVHWVLGDYEQTRVNFARSLAGYRADGDAAGEARALARLGMVYLKIGDYQSALTHQVDALALARRSGSRHSTAAQLLNLGFMYRLVGRYEEAVAHHQAAAELFTELGDRRLAGYAHGNLGVVYARQGRYEAALEALATALARCREAGDLAGEGSSLASLGEAYHRMGRHPEALVHLHRALALSRETGDLGLETEALNTLGATLACMGQHDAALDRHRSALELARGSGERYEQARALAGIGDAQAASGDLAGAREHWQRALDGYVALGVPEADEVRARLSG